MKPRLEGAVTGTRGVGDLLYATPQPGAVIGKIFTGTSNIPPWIAAHHRVA